MKPFYMSSKLWYTVATVAAAVISKYAGLDYGEVLLIVSAGIALIVGQGMADFGKNASKEEENKPKPSLFSVPEDKKQQ